MRRVLAALALFVLAACAQEDGTAPKGDLAEKPDLLSDWGMISSDGKLLRLGDRVVPYDLATPLFSDYASKLRTLWMPRGSAAVYHPEDAFGLPVGTIITKTFYYKHVGAKWDRTVLQEPAIGISKGSLPLDGLRLIETRILVRRESGWEALPYVWNAAQTDAVLKRTGDIIPLTLARNDQRQEVFAYLVPNTNQCAGCHATKGGDKAVEPIGLKARHLNRPSPYLEGLNQLDHWFGDGLFKGVFANARAAPRNAVWDDDAEKLNDRARAYLDVNCSHCHNPDGPADTSGLNLEPDALGPGVGLCKSPIAAGGGSGGLPYDIVPGAPEASITVFRMKTKDPGAMMPELGRATTHEEGVALIAEWIAAMEGGCL